MSQEWSLIFQIDSLIGRSAIEGDTVIEETIVSLLAAVSRFNAG